MTHATRFVAVAVLVALAVGAPVQAQTPEFDALRVRAEAGDADAQDNLGFIYEYGEGVPQDDAEGVWWFRLAADQGYTSAQFNLGVMYANGFGVPEDDVEAVRWYRLAADQGDASAQFNLGFMYVNGEGVPQDDVQAHMWFNLAASLRLTGEFGVWNRDSVAGRMNPTQIAEAERLAREWDAAWGFGELGRVILPARLSRLLTAVSGFSSVIRAVARVYHKAVSLCFG